MHEQRSVGDSSLTEDDELGRDGRWRCGSEAKATTRTCLEGLKLVNAYILPATRCVARNNPLNL